MIEHSDIFRALSDPTRRALFERLCRKGDQSVHALTAEAGISQPAVSKHLGILRQAGLVSGHQEGRETRYHAEVTALMPLIDWTQEMRAFWEPRLDSLEDLLNRMDQ